VADPRVENLAKLLVNYCVEVGPGDEVLLNGHLLTRPLMIATYREIVRAGGHPLVFWSASEMQEIMLKEGNDEQLTHLHEPLVYIYENFDCAISLLGTDNTRVLNGVDPARQQLAQSSRRELAGKMMERSASGEYRWVGTMFPTQAFAQEADMSLSEYEDFVYKACFADKKDPVAEWQKMHDRQEQLINWLAGKRHLKVQGPHVELTLSFDGRTFINDDGHKNMPGGEIFTSPVEDSVNGWVRFSHPAIYLGREVEGIELRFENGKVVDATARKNQDFLLSTLDTDEGARILGEFAIGTNNGIQRFTKSLLFDEKIGGTIHMAVGRGFPEVGGKNVSAVHWDMICDMRDGGQIWVDDELFYESGAFVV